MSARVGMGAPPAVGCCGRWLPAGLGGSDADRLRSCPSRSAPDSVGWWARALRLPADEWHRSGARNGGLMPFLVIPARKRALRKAPCTLVRLMGSEAVEACWWF